MDEPQGRLDGIQDIIPPLLPLSPQADLLLIGLVFLTLTVICLVYVVYYYRRIDVRARRLYRQAIKLCEKDAGRSCGDSVMAFLRLYQQTSYLISVAEMNHLMKLCNKVRFCGREHMPARISELKLALDTISWTRH